MSTKTFCIFPFTGLSTKQDGEIKLCYRSRAIGNISNNSLEEIWNSDSICRIRKQLLNGERPPECAPCFSLEDIGVESLRQRHLLPNNPQARINLYSTELEKLNEDYSMPFEFPVLEVKVNNLCNFKCRMCNPTDSTSWNDWGLIEDFYKIENNKIVDQISSLNLKNSPLLSNFEDNDNWWESFNKIIPFLRKVEFAGGEPLIDPYHYRILESLVPYGNNIELRYSTNLSTLGKGNRNIYEFWPHFKNIIVNVSIDGVGESYEYIRSNSSWDTLVENINKIKSIPNVSFVAGLVAVQISNVLLLDKMIDCFLNELEIAFYTTNMVRYPNLLSPQVLPKELKTLAIARLKDVKKKLPSYKLTQSDQNLENITQTHIDSVIKFIEAEDLSHLWNNCVEFNHRLDASRNQTAFEIVNPEFKPYIK